ncbi:MAG: class B sortase [Erysipelotrichaceae bacterium]|nr:class B sortase [Erysipelotrichaceae bacterium]
MKKIALALALLLALTSCKSEEKTLDDISSDRPTAERSAFYKQVNEAWDEKHGINDDYVGEVSVGNLLTCSFVQGDSNDSYLRTDWQTMEHDEEGSIFLDSRNGLDDQNLIIYGHYVYSSYEPSGTHMFTPLRLLIEEDNYEDNRYVTLQLENEIRTYEIAYVFYVDTYLSEGGIRNTEEGLQYYHTNFDEGYFSEYIRNAAKASFYDTGVKVDFTDSILTLQTCVEGNTDLREIVIARLVSTEKTR